MSHETHAGVVIIPTTARYREGQEAARLDFKKDPELEPIGPLLLMAGPEFKAGYLDELVNFLRPAYLAEQRRKS